MPIRNKANGSAIVNARWIVYDFGGQTGARAVAMSDSVVSSDYSFFLPSFLNPGALFVLLFDGRGLRDEGINGTVQRLSPWLNMLEQVSQRYNHKSRPPVLLVANFMRQIAEPAARKAAVTDMQEVMRRLNAPATEDSGRPVHPLILEAFATDLYHDGSCQQEKEAHSKAEPAPKWLPDAFLQRHANDCACMEGQQPAATDLSCSHWAYKRMQEFAEDVLSDKQAATAIEEVESRLSGSGKKVIRGREYYAMTAGDCRRVLKNAQPDRIENMQNTILLFLRNHGLVQYNLPAGTNKIVRLDDAALILLDPSLVPQLYGQAIVEKRARSNE